jgi:hypothetical protein
VDAKKAQSNPRGMSAMDSIVPSTDRSEILPEKAIRDQIADLA